jgi:hypothetical protein
LLGDFACAATVFPLDGDGAKHGAGVHFTLSRL